MTEINDGIDEEDEDEENEGFKKKVVKRKKNKNATYITEEANGDTIVDFLDASAAQKVRSSKPNITTKATMNNPSMKKKNEFEIGMISHKMSLITIFGHKHKIKDFINMNSL